MGNNNIVQKAEMKNIHHCSAHHLTMKTNGRIQIKQITVP